jgi:hypothetical protein
VLRSLACLLALVVAGAALAAEDPAPAADVHAFYYAWYGTPAVDGRWVHWNHPILLRDGEGPRHAPPDDLGASFYPQAGPYSSCSAETVDRHFVELQRAGCGVAVVSWWGPQDGGDGALPLVFAAAARHGVAIAFHVEPFRGRGAGTTRAALVSLLDRWGDHPALCRRDGRPVVYVYDSYLTPPAEWATLLKPDGEITLRGTRYDVVAIGLWVGQGDGEALLAGGFDGAYTYFATDGFTFGSTAANWAAMAEYARARGMLFVPCVGPGYADLRVRPWNTGNQRDREGGAYYDRLWQAAIDARPPVVGVTSFNEWHEGTQIEPAVPFVAPGFTYLDYGELGPAAYLDRTRHWVEVFLGREGGRR